MNYAEFLKRQHRDINDIPPMVWKDQKKVIRGRGYLGVQKSVSNQLYDMKYLEDKLTAAELSGLVEMIHDHVKAAWQEGLIQGEESKQTEKTDPDHVVCYNCGEDFDVAEKYRSVRLLEQVLTTPCPRCGKSTIGLKRPTKKKDLRCSKCGIRWSSVRGDTTDVCTFCGGKIVDDTVCYENR